MSNYEDRGEEFSAEAVVLRRKFSTDAGTLGAGGRYAAAEGLQQGEGQRGPLMAPSAGACASVPASTEPGLCAAVAAC